MAHEILMPQFDARGTPGVVLQWLCAVGDDVCEGQPLVMVESRKAVFELEAYAAGTLRATVVKPGELARPHTLLGVLGSPDEPLDGLLARAAAERADAPRPTNGRGTHDD